MCNKPWKSHNVFLWGELSSLVYPVKSIGYLRVLEYFNAIYICDCLSNVTSRPEDEHKCLRKTLESNYNDYHLHDIWCFTLSYKQSITDHSWYSWHKCPKAPPVSISDRMPGDLNKSALHWLWVIGHCKTLNLLNTDPGCLKLDCVFNMNRLSHLRDSE